MADEERDLNDKLSGPSVQTPASTLTPIDAEVEPTIGAMRHRAVEAAMWGMPLVSVDAMRQAFLRDAGAQYGDILYFSKPPNWRFQITTPDASALHVYFNFNLKDGPVVVEMPAAVGAAVSGTLMDAWEMPLADVGLEGDDRGKGAKYVLLPPYDHRSLIDGHIVVRSRTYNGYGWLRAIPVRSSVDDTARAIALVKKMRTYPLAQSLNPPPQRHIDIAGMFFEGLVRFDDSFYDSLARMVSEEPVQTRDVATMTQLRLLGIEKGCAFRPDQATREVLREAIGHVHEHLTRAVTVGGSYWPGSQWILSSIVGARHGFGDEALDHMDIDERSMRFFLGYAVPKKLGAGTFYTGAYRDAAGELLQGDRTYRLRIPPDVPVKQSWAVTAYDLATAAFMCGSPQLTIDSGDYRVQTSDDGSIEVTFGPEAPAEGAANWIYTAPGRPWFAFFRFYRPEKALFDKTWMLPDITRTTPVSSVSRVLRHAG